MKKFFAILMSVALMLSLAVPAMAEGETYTITINGATGHTYEVYQIFTGDLSGNVLSNIVWGNGVSADGQTALGNAATVADSITNAKAFAASIDQYLTNPSTMDESNGTYNLSGLKAGYYLIKDKDDTQDGTDGTYTAYILKVVKDVTATPKDSVPTVDKSVTEQGKNADDFEIGDIVTFILKATLGDNVDEYTSYKLVFHDTLSAGLTYNSITSVTVNGTTVTEGYTVAHNAGNLTITFADVTDQGATNNSEIIVTYTATLNSGAEIGTPGNSNTVKLEYSNNPNADGAGSTAETPEDKVLVFTYELDVIKVDGEDKDKKLKDAEFKLRNEAGEWATVENGKLTGWVTSEDSATVLKSDAEGKFMIAGLDAATYYLKETKAPAGYNLLDKEIEIVIAATLNTAEDSAALTSLTISVNSGAAEDGVLDTGIVSTTVENNAGATLPETGGMGTTIFYIVGGIMVVGAVVLLVTKKRMSAEG